MSPFSFISRRKAKMVKIDPFGGDLREAPISPEQAIARMGVREFLILLLLCIAISLTLLNIGLSLVAQLKASSTVYVADGTPFGCEVQEVGQ